MIGIALLADEPIPGQIAAACMAHFVLDLFWVTRRENNKYQVRRLIPILALALIGGGWFWAASLPLSYSPPVGIALFTILPGFVLYLTYSILSFGKSVLGKRREILSSSEETEKK